MDPSTKVIGLKIKLMDTEDWFMLMEMFMKVNGIKIRLMEEVNIFIWMARNILVTGWKTNNMVLV